MHESLEVRLVELHELPQESFTSLLEASWQEELFLLTRLREEWKAGVNRFDDPGEVLYGAFLGDRLAGVGGLNVDPYVCDVRIGRVRRLYVAPDLRRRGIGRRLVEAIIHAARGLFDELRLRTDSTPAARFYEALGFTPHIADACTHRLILAPALSPAPLVYCGLRQAVIEDLRPQPWHGEFDLINDSHTELALMFNLGPLQYLDLDIRDEAGRVVSDFYYGSLFSNLGGIFWLHVPPRSTYSRRLHLLGNVSDRSRLAPGVYIVTAQYEYEEMKLVSPPLTITLTEEHCEHFRPKT
jgi:GNAT superfamily N-acetyltransferase